ncbi:hypothetical protein [Lutimaribacter saemankumensis]|uniref:Uncharacterized protein n=1 Tax=Lutimaribacter saemankumensis TaxID=490829 RepID=A0A1G8RYK5_9RHOB|nr:hypothetical protein [Lutimaribacter saemankumensis]SDJ21500.1 hypothetical protein SAMN05421850_11043 [Lutimaribacter saemankumensis]
MQTIQTGARGLGLLVKLNWDRILFVGTIYICLVFATYLYSL